MEHIETNFTNMMSYYAEELTRVEQGEKPSTVFSPSERTALKRNQILDTKHVSGGKEIIMTEKARQHRELLNIDERNKQNQLHYFREELEAFRDGAPALKLFNFGERRNLTRTGVIDYINNRYSISEATLEWLQVDELTQLYRIHKQKWLKIRAGEPVENHFTPLQCEALRGKHALALLKTHPRKYRLHQKMLSTIIRETPDPYNFQEKSRENLRTLYHVELLRVREGELAGKVFTESEIRTLKKYDILKGNRNKPRTTLSPETLQWLTDNPLDD